MTDREELNKMIREWADIHGEDYKEMATVGELVCLLSTAIKAYPMIAERPISVSWGDGDDDWSFVHKGEIDVDEDLQIGLRI